MDSQLARARVSRFPFFGFWDYSLKRKRTVRTAEVTIETEEILLRPVANRRNLPMWCPNCRRKVEMVTPEHAAQIAGVTLRTIYRWVDAATVHFVEDRGSVLICVPALTLHAARASETTKHSEGSKR